jgi:hypothetical protein
MVGFMATAFAEEAMRIHRDAHLSDVVIGEAVGAKPSTVRDWLSVRLAVGTGVVPICPASASVGRVRR